MRQRIHPNQLQKKFGGEAEDIIQFWPPRCPSQEFGIDPTKITDRENDLQEERENDNTRTKDTIEVDLEENDTKSVISRHSTRLDWEKSKGRATSRTTNRRHLLRPKKKDSLTFNQIKEKPKHDDQSVSAYSMDGLISIQKPGNIYSRG
jgi:hypothetical protein